MLCTYSDDIILTSPLLLLLTYVNYIRDLISSIILTFSLNFCICDYRAKAQLGSCIRVADDIRQALHKAILLFSLPALAFEDLSEPQSMM